MVVAAKVAKSKSASYRGAVFCRKAPVRKAGRKAAKPATLMMLANFDAFVWPALSQPVAALPLDVALEDEIAGMLLRWTTRQDMADELETLALGPEMRFMRRRLGAAVHAKPPSGALKPPAWGVTFKRFGQTKEAARAAEVATMVEQVAGAILEMNAVIAVAAGREPGAYLHDQAEHLDIELRQHVYETTRSPEERRCTMALLELLPLLMTIEAVSASRVRADERQRRHILALLAERCLQVATLLATTLGYARMPFVPEAKRVDTNYFVRAAVQHEANVTRAFKTGSKALPR